QGFGGRQGWGDRRHRWRSLQGHSRSGGEPDDQDHQHRCAAVTGRPGALTASRRKAKGPPPAGPFLSVVCELEMHADILEDVANITQLLTARGSSLRHEVENLTVFETVVGKTRDAAIPVEINGTYALIIHLMRHEGCGSLCLLRDVVESLAINRGDSRRRAKHDQDLLLGGADRKLFERAFGQHVTALQ